MPKIVRDFPALSVRGINYYPALTPWGRMWPETPGEVFEHDMALAESLNINAVRTFLTAGKHCLKSGLLDSDGHVTRAYLEKIEQFLAAANRHGIKVVFCFDFTGDWLQENESERHWKRVMSEIVKAHCEDGRVLLWDLMNEPESRKWDEASHEYLREAPDHIHKSDSTHLTTVGIGWEIGKLAELGLPDVCQYHEYAPKTEIFSKGTARIEHSIRSQRLIGGTRPLLLGEFGMCTSRDLEYGEKVRLDQLKVPPGTEEEQRRLYETVFAAAENAHVAGAFPWCLFDFPDLKDPNESRFGIIRQDSTLKPAALVVKKYYARWIISK